MKILNKTKYVPLLIIGYALIYAGNIMVESISGFIHGKVSLIVMVRDFGIFSGHSIFIRNYFIHKFNEFRRKKESLKERLSP